MQKFKRIHVEIGNICNLSCSFCPVPSKAKTLMSPSDFQRVAKEIAPYTEEVALHLLGEPLNHPEFEKMIDLCAQVKLPVNLVTNGLMMHGNRLNALLSPIIRQVSFSLQSFTDNFPDQDPLIYLKRIRAFTDRASLERPDLFINLRFWDLTGHDPTQEQQNSALREACAEIFSFSWSDVKIDVRRRKNHRIRGRIYLHFDSRFEWPDINGEFQATKGYCHGLSGHIGIHADGSVVPCCLDQAATINLGNIFDSPLGDILRSERAVNIKQGFEALELREALCQRCSYIRRFDHKVSRLSRNKDAKLKTHQKKEVSFL